jgi:NTP pyrophosphatase (non-canonical NTP hydrolase)
MSYKYDCLGCEKGGTTLINHEPSCRAWNARKQQEQSGPLLAVDPTDIDEYGEWAERMWFSGDRPSSVTERDLSIMTLGLAGETGEVVEKVKKVIRDGTIDKAAILKELGDVLYYTVKIARYFGFKPSDIVTANVEKLESRRARGVQRGSGDNR